MYKIDFTVEMAGVMPEYVTLTGGGFYGSIETNVVRIMGDKLYCEVDEGFLHIIPLKNLVTVHYIGGDNDIPEQYDDAFMYRQFDRYHKEPTGLATYDGDYLCKWLMDGYDVEICTVSGNTKPHYVTTDSDRF